MKLHTYIKTLKKEDKTAFKGNVIKRAKVTKAAFSHWLTGIRKPNPKAARIIELESKGAVSVRETRPDDYLID